LLPVLILPGGRMVGPAGLLRPSLGSTPLGPSRNRLVTQRPKLLPAILSNLQRLQLLVLPAGRLVGPAGLEPATKRL
jgi:hypothetical protein